jgi:beta-glucosidase
MKFFFFIFMTSLLMGATAPLMAQTARPPESRSQIQWWAKRLAEKEAQAQAQHDTVLIGDSITHNWDIYAPEALEHYFKGALNLGFSGDRTEHVLWRIRRIDWTVVAPKRIMLMIGTNNTGHSMMAPGKIFNDIRVLVKELKASCPEAQIMVLKIFPRGKTAEDPKRKNNDAVNLMLELLAAEDRVTVRDVSHLYLEANGDLKLNLMPDALHPNLEGYKAWGDAIAPEFMAMPTKD